MRRAADESTLLDDIISSHNVTRAPRPYMLCLCLLPMLLSADCTPSSRAKEKVHRWMAGAQNAESYGRPTGQRRDATNCQTLFGG